jgi:hypothetical protein
VKRVACGIVCVLVAIGCDSGSYARVSGKVTVDGAPLASGAIRLVPLDGKSPTAGAEIEDGEFLIDKAPVTAVRVEIFAPRVVGKRKAYDEPQSPLIDVTKESLPEKYNIRSELKKELIKGDNEFNFDLKTK